MDAPPDAPHPPPGGPAPLVGRAREQNALRDALSAALTSHGSLILIGGEAGIGKTALAEWLLAEVRRAEALALVGRCYDLSETPPYGPWAEALTRAPGTDAVPAPPALAGDGGAASQAALFALVRDYLAALAARRPLVLLLEDLHWADPASLDLLRAVGRQLDGVPLLLLATYRAEEVARDHPLHALLPLLVREARAVRLDLRPLDEAAIATLVAARYALGEPDRARLVAYLAGRTEGNALFLGELLRTLEGDGTLQRAEGAWQLGGLEDVPVPALLRQVIEGRAARLGDAARHLLTLAAVIGQVVPLGLWANVAETDEDGLLDTVERAVAARLLAEAPDGQAVRFAHALIREALYAGLLATRRRRVHRRAGEALLALPDADPDAVAYHLRQAGDPRAAEWLIAAGERARRAYAWPTAAARYEAALRLLEQRGADARERARLLLTLAQLRRYAAPRDGIAHLEEAERLAAEASDPALAVGARFDRGHLRCFVGEVRRGVAEMAAALPALEALPAAERARLPALVVLGVTADEPYHRGVLVHWLAQVGRYTEALAGGGPIATGAAGATARGLTGLGQAYAALGRPDEAGTALAAAREIHRAAGQHHEVFQVLEMELGWVVLPYQADSVVERRRLAAEAAEAEGRGRAAIGESNPFHHGTNALLLLEGRWDAVADATRRARGRGLYNTRSALLARHRGEDEAARALLAETLAARLPAGSATEPGDLPFLVVLPLQRLAAELALDAGDLPIARAWLEAHDHWLAWGGAALGRAEGALGWAAYHRAAGDRAQAREHAEAALAHASAPRQPLARLAAHRALGELATAEGHHADAQAHLDAALALAEACAAPYERALTLLALAELRAATGERAAARAPLAEARAILADLGARPALARADALAARSGAPDRPRPAYPAGLTAREVAVLRRIAAGESNRAIAAALGISVRTVNRHITNLYTKIDAHGKADATAYALRHGLA